MIKQFDKATCRLIGQEVEAALAAVAAKHGLVATYAGGSFTGAEFTAKARFSLAQSNPAAADAERAEFAQYCEFFGLKPEHYGKTVSTPKGELTLIGFELKRSKFPIKVRHANGEVKLYTAEVTKRFA